MKKEMSCLVGSTSGSKLNSLKNSYFSYFVLYLFYYLSWSLFSSLISVYLMGQGFSAAQASFVVSVSFLTSMLFQPSIGSLAKKIGLKKSTLFCMTATLIGGILFLFSKNFIAITLAYSFVMTLINGINPVMEKICTSSPFSYGKIRMWGTVGYAMGTQLAAWLHDLVAPWAIFVAFLFFVILCMAGGMLIQPYEEQKTSSAFMEEKKEEVGFKSLLKNQKFMTYLLIAGIFYGVTSAINTFMPSLLTDQGMDMTVVGTLLSIAVLVELPLIIFSGKFMDQMTSKSLTYISFAMALVLVLCCFIPSLDSIQLPVVMLTKHPSGMIFIMLNLKIVTSLLAAPQVLSGLALVAAVKNLVSMLFNSIMGLAIDWAGYEMAFAGLGLCLILGAGIVFCFKMPKGQNLKLFS